MPVKKRAPSKTVDLAGFTESELFALVDVALPMREMELLPMRAFRAVERLQGAYLRLSRRPGSDERMRMRRIGLIPKEPADVAVSKIPRQSLQTLANALRPAVKAHSRQYPAIVPAMQKVDARLEARPGRRGESEDEWRRRSDEVRARGSEIRDKLGETPTDSTVEFFLGLSPGTLRNWRRRHRDLFPPFTS